MAYAVVQRLRGTGVRGIARRLKISPTLAGEWVRAEREKESVRDFVEKTRAAVVEFLEGLPAESSPTYAEGIRFAVERMEKSLTELRAMIATSDERASPAAIAATKKAVEASKKALQDPNAQKVKSSDRARRSS